MKRFQHLGVGENTDPDTARVIRIVNLMSLSSIFFALILIVYSLWVGLPRSASLFFSLILVSLTVPILFNFFGRSFASRLFFLINAYLIIFSLPIIFGQAIHFQFYLMGGIGMPLIFFKNEIGPAKIFLSLIAIVLWLYLEWHFTQFDPFVEIPTYGVYPIRLLNDFLVFLTIFLIAFAFTNESNKQIVEIEQKTADLGKANKNLREASEELEQFVYSVSHNLLAPVRHIEAYAERIKENDFDNLSLGGQDDLNKVNTSVMRLGGMIDSLLEYTRSRNAQPKKEQIDTEELVKSISEEFKSSHPKQEIEIQIGTLPSSYADPSMLRDVWENLISNAIKYSSKMVKTRIIIEGQEREGETFFSIKDNGEGYDPRFAKKLFTIFERLHNQSEFPGFGIGLANVARILQLHNGRVWSESKLGNGATFYFSFPVQ
ncbi:MAG: ATP-binding protein [Bacteroidota bacterium]